MTASNRLSILFITDNKDYTETLGSRIQQHYADFTLARTEEDALKRIRKKPVDLMILGFETVQQNEVFYLHLLRADPQVDQRIAYIMLLTIRQDVQTAFESCLKNIFNDYYLACPLYDINYILIRLREIERLLLGQQRNQAQSLLQLESCLEQLLSSGQRLGELNDATEQRLQQILLDAMEQLQQRLAQQGADPGTLKLVAQQAQLTRTSALADSPQLYESRQLINDMVDRTRQQREQLGRSNRGRHSDQATVVAHIDQQRSQQQQQHDTLDVQLNDAATMDSISPDSLIPGQGIMIIEDEMKQLSRINEILARQGLITYPAQSGSEALRDMANWQPAIVLIDLTLPDISALHVISRISNHPALSHTRIIAMANQNERDLVLEAARAGVKQVVLKPVDKKLLSQRIQNNLDVVRQTLESA
ncbi:MAG: response regulator [Marinobacterium sp.]|nr:response regulator [Marinobacterium sp.]